jgi:hypothetical protein
MMKLLNIALVSLLALSTTSVALAEGGSERSLQAVKDFRIKQSQIHGKRKADSQLEQATIKRDSKGQQDSSKATRSNDDKSI